VSNREVLLRGNCIKGMEEVKQLFQEKEEQQNAMRRHTMELAEAMAYMPGLEAPAAPPPQAAAAAAAAPPQASAAAAAAPPPQAAAAAAPPQAPRVATASLPQGAAAAAAPPPEASAAAAAAPPLQAAAATPEPYAKTESDEERSLVEAASREDARRAEHARVMRYRRACEDKKKKLPSDIAKELAKGTDFYALWCKYNGEWATISEVWERSKEKGDKCKDFWATMTKKELEDKYSHCPEVAKEIMQHCVKNRLIIKHPQAPENEDAWTYKVWAGQAHTFHSANKESSATIASGSHDANADPELRDAMADRFQAPLSLHVGVQGVPQAAAPAAAEAAPGAAGDGQPAESKKRKRTPKVLTEEEKANRQAMSDVSKTITKLGKVKVEVRRLVDAVRNDGWVSTLNLHPDLEKHLPQLQAMQDALEAAKRAKEPDDAKKLLEQAEGLADNEELTTVMVRAKRLLGEEAARKTRQKGAAKAASAES